MSPDITLPIVDEPSVPEGDMSTVMHASKAFGKKDKSSLRKTKSCDMFNDETGGPTTSSSFVPTSTAINKAKSSKHHTQNSLESSVEDESRKQGSPELSLSTPDSSHGSPRLESLKAVKNR